MPLQAGDEVCVLVNGLGATSIEELYILYADVADILQKRGSGVYRVFVGEYATSMEMAGASVSLYRMDGELKQYMDYPVKTPFYCQK